MMIRDSQPHGDDDDWNQTNDNDAYDYDNDIDKESPPPLDVSVLLTECRKMRNSDACNESVLASFQNHFWF